MEFKQNQTKETDLDWIFMTDIVTAWLYNPL